MRIIKSIIIFSFFLLPILSEAQSITVEDPEGLVCQLKIDGNANKLSNVVISLCDISLEISRMKFISEEYKVELDSENVEKGKFIFRDVMPGTWTTSTKID